FESGSAGRDSESEAQSHGCHCEEREARRSNLATPAERFLRPRGGVASALRDCFGRLRRPRNDSRGLARLLRLCSRCSCGWGRCFGPLRRVDDDADAWEPFALASINASGRLTATVSKKGSRFYGE